MLLVLNNYSLTRVQAEVNAGLKPAHHLYAADLLATRHHHQVHILPSPEENPPGPLQRLLQRLLPLGDLPQQWLAWKHRHTATLIYAPCQTQTALLSYLRALRLFPVPILALAHHPPAHGRLPWLRAPLLRLQLKGTDSFPALSRTLARHLDTLARRPISVTLPWGPDLTRYPVPDFTHPGHGAIAAGRTGRDFPTLAHAAHLAQVPTHIIAPRTDPLAIAPQPPAPPVTLTTVNQESDLPYPRLIPLLAAARVHAIPLAPGSALAGLTSLTDALALGKPIIATRHPLLDIDLEAEGIGITVPPSDPHAWADALRWFHHHPEESLQMGRRARHIAETRLNHHLFADHLHHLIQTLLK